MKKSDTEAQGVSEFFAREYSRLSAFIRSNIRDSTAYDAEDIVQDVALNIFSKVDLESPIENLAVYVYRAVKNKIIDIYRKKSRNASVFLYEDMKYDDNESSTFLDSVQDRRTQVHAELIKKELQEILYDSIENLNPDQRAVWVATELEGKTFEELSQEWGAPVGTLLSRKHRANSNLQKMLVDYKKYFES